MHLRVVADSLFWYLISLNVCFSVFAQGRPRFPLCQSSPPWVALLTADRQLAPSIMTLTSPILTVYRNPIFRALSFITLRIRLSVQQTKPWLSPRNSVSQLLNFCGVITPNGLLYPPGRMLYCANLMPIPLIPSSVAMSQVWRICHPTAWVSFRVLLSATKQVVMDIYLSRWHPSSLRYLLVLYFHLQVRTRIVP